MQADYQSTKFRGQDWPCDFSKLPLVEKLGEARLCKALHFREGRYAVKDAAFEVRNRLSASARLRP